MVKNRPLPPWTGAEDFPEEERWRGQIVVDPVVTYLRFSLAIYLVIGVLWAVVLLNEYVFGDDSESVWASVAPLLCLFAALPIYVIVVRLMLHGRGYRGVEVRYVIGKAVVVVLAWLLWIDVHDVVRRLWPSLETASGGYDQMGGFLMETMALLVGPILVAVVFYHICLGQIRYHQIDLDLRRAGLRPMSGEGSKPAK